MTLKFFIIFLILILDNSATLIVQVAAAEIIAKGGSCTFKGPFRWRCQLHALNIVTLLFTNKISLNAPACIIAAFLGTNNNKVKIYSHKKIIFNRGKCRENIEKI